MLVLVLIIYFESMRKSIEQLRTAGTVTAPVSGGGI